MANRHFGKIGDIWKHLPLAELLGIEKPRRYWESHCGSARYPLTRSPDRDYGVFYFLEHFSQQVSLRDSAYAALLTRMTSLGELAEYPGSPLIAMQALRDQTTRYLFADIDPQSLTSVRTAGRQLQIEEDRLILIEGDGVKAIEQAADELPPNEAESTFVHLDPYRPFLKSAGGVNCLELFARLTACGLQTMLWYGFDSCEYREMLVGHTCKAFTGDGSARGVPPLWCGEILLAALDDPAGEYNPGVLACGILCGNLSRKSEVACERLGVALAAIYENATLPSGRSGAIRFRSERIQT